VEQAFTIDVNNTNELPTAISLSNTTIEETTAGGTAIATIDATDANASDEHTFKLVTGDGSNDVDNAKFIIEGDQLVIKQSASFEAQSSYNIYLRASDTEGSVEQAFVIDVNDTNQAPTAIELSTTSVDESMNPGSTIATITATDPNESDTHTFSLVDGDGTNDAHNDMFVIVNSNLILIGELEFDELSTLNINIRANDGYETYDQSFTLTINEVLGFSSEARNTLGIYPNPGNDRFQINMESDLRGDVTIKVSDLSGKIIHQATLFKHAQKFTYPIDMSAVQTGIYLIELRTGSEVITQRWIKK
jgi:hypothetical protein